MNRSRTISGLLLLCSLFGIGECERIWADQVIKFKTVSLDEFLGRGQFILSNIGGTSCPVHLDIPAVYVRTPAAEDSLESIWCAPEDVQNVLDANTPSPQGGFFVARLSMNVGYDAERDTFVSGAGGKAEESFAEEAKGAGFQNMSVARYDVQGVPVLILESESPNGRRSLLAYVALRIATNSIRIHYAHGRRWSESDAQIWTRFKESLVRGGTKRR